MELNINEAPMQNGSKESLSSLWGELLQNHNIKMGMENSPEAAELEKFLNSEEGKVALEVLKASKKRIDLVRTESTGNWETRYWISKDGLCSQAHNFSYGNQREEIEHATPEEMFRDMRYCNKTHGITEKKYPCSDMELVSWIKEEITKIGKTL